MNQMTKITTLPGFASALVALAAIAPQADAAFIYPFSVATDGGEFNATTFPVENLYNGGHTAGTDTENASDLAANRSYATSNPITGTRPLTLTLEFSSTVDLSHFYLWNHSHNGAAAATANGLNDFTLTFYDGAGGSGTQIGAVFSDNAAQAPSSGNYAAEAFDVGIRNGVRSVVLSGNDHNLTGFIGIRELGFEAVPEPSSTALLGLGGLALILRRRK